MPEMQSGRPAREWVLGLRPEIGNQIGLEIGASQKTGQNSPKIEHRARTLFSGFFFPRFWEGPIPDLFRAEGPKPIL